jgi:uncharacterized repeat protein (TIGR01451 family)
MKLASPNKDVSINPNGIIELADITVEKVVDTGTARPAQWCFNITPNPNSVTLPLCPAPGTSTVTFVALQTGSYTITETQTVAGYTFASGNGSNCTFVVGTATASVIAAVVPQDASCIFHNASAPPTVTVDKTAAPASLPEPGGDFTFSVVVTNTSTTETVTITSLSDDTYPWGANSTCDELVGDTLGPLATANCTFTGNFTGNAGASETDIVTVVVTDTDGQTATHSDDAVVGISGVDPTVTVLKTASPLSRPEPGGSFTFSVVVTNTSAEPVTITSLSDDIHPWGANSTCDELVGDPLAAGAFVTCSFTGNFTGNAGASQTDIVTVLVTDDDGTTATHNDDAVVGLSGVDPTVTVLKTASPLSLPEPGGNFTFTVVVNNTSAEAVTITSLVDDKYNLTAVDGDCDELVGDTLAAGASATCTFTGAFNGNAGGSQTDVVTVVVTDDDNETATNNDDATVTLTNVAPTVTVTKTASPSSLPEPGGNSTYTVVVTNTSAEAVTITSLTDSIYNLATVAGNCDDLLGDTLAAGASVSCTFTGNFTGNAGESETDTVTVVVTDDDDTTATDDDDATVTLTDVAPTLTLVKTASPSSLPAPGGNFTYTVVITNTSAEAVTITSLTDSIYKLATVAGDCDDLVGDILAAGASVTCTFTGNFTGTDGDTETDVVTVVVTDDDGTRATQIDDATVNLGPAPVVPVVVAGETIVLAPAPAVLPAAELPRTGSRELQRQVLLALGLVLAGATFRLVNRRRRFNSA